MKEHRLEVDVPALEPGLVGLVRAVAMLASEDPDELLGISSAAFCTYAFDPEFNQHEPERREFSPFAGLFSNYGPWESIGYYTGRDVREVIALPAVETLKVVVFEIEQGRPLVTLTAGLEPALVTGYRIGVKERTILTTAGEVEVLDDAPIQGDDEVFRNWLLLVRPGQTAEWAATKARQRISVLRWAVEHAENPKEFFQETRESYAPGLEGWRRFRRFLDGLTEPAAVAYAEGFLRSTCSARIAASRCLGAWASSISAELDEAMEPTLDEAARAYGAVADALRRADNFVEAVDAALVHERAAIDALRRAARRFPAAFEAL